jgi:hypothetical protein
MRTWLEIALAESVNAAERALASAALTNLPELASAI